MPEGQIAVLIDYENVGLGPMQWLFDQISDIGRVIVKRAYADWSVAGNSRDQLLELGIEPIHLFHTTASGKNSSDIRLAIDAIELLHQSPVDTFVIVSSDSDFVPLVSRLRSAGKTVIGAGREATVSRTLVTSCDRYFYLDQEVKPIRSGQSSEYPHKGSLLVRAMNAVMDEQGRALGTKLRETVQRLDPAFDFRSLGHTTFSKYLEASTEVKVTRPRGRGDITVELSETLPLQNGWDAAIDSAWFKRSPIRGGTIAGPTAAGDAAVVLRVAKLKASVHKTLQGLLDASPLLRANWTRDGNKITRQV